LQQQQQQQPPRAATPSESNLEEQLARERGLRVDAESRLASVSTELEELTQSLFEEANAMVASERKARARVEERLKACLDREEANKRRLGELEKAVGRITRVRSVLGDNSNTIA